eukprot:TRINITY_DN19636_c0_g1_i1.p1 TRINITY_DN19636_c0_g1~~TRINITY_DN19636_c0_g1_i1.p1  ORF type:complete len:750 (-),score=144.85 TRINITY_DN19636_c0_g1_i1:58-2307(-)
MDAESRGIFHNLKKHPQRTDPLDLEDLGTSPDTTPPVTSPGAETQTPFSGIPTEDVNVTAETALADVATPVGALGLCSSDALLADVARLLLSTGQTVAMVVDQAGTPAGLLSENDILVSYLLGSPFDVTVSEWMHGGGGVTFDASVAPSGVAEMQFSKNITSVAPEQSLRDALPFLTGPVPSGERASFGSLLVRTSAGYGGGVLSHLNVAQAVADGCLPDLDVIGEAAATVEDYMTPLEEVHALTIGFTMQQLLQELLLSPARAVLVVDQVGSLHGLATASDALWAFHERISRSMDPWEIMSVRSGRLGLQSHMIPADVPLRKAAAAMLSTQGVGGDACLRDLIAVDTGTGKTIGMLSPWYLTKEIATRVSTSESAKATQHIQARLPASLQDRPQKRRRAVKPINVTVADIVAQRETATCTPSHTLADAADALAASGRTAVVVEDGNIAGVLTENDLLSALLEDTPWDCKIESWIRGGHSRLPGFILPGYTVPPTMGLAEAAAEMMMTAEEPGGFGCHHLLVCDWSAGSKTSGVSSLEVRLLSALDIARGMINAETAGRGDAASSCGCDADAVMEASSITVEEAMKGRIGRNNAVASCDLTDPLKKAFKVMHASHQNCALLVDSGTAERVQSHSGQEEAGDSHMIDEEFHGKICGFITTADALQAFSKRVTGDDITAASWLRRTSHSTPTQRSISADASLSDAALTMAECNVHHLLVRGSAEQGIVGVISALDMVCALGSRYRRDHDTV